MTDDPTKPDQTTETTDEQLWASPMAGEDARWFQRFSLYAAMGACRSVRAVYNAELAERGKGSSASKSVPGSWHKASQSFAWKKRAQAFDEWRRKEIFNAGNAQDTERIKKLDKLIDRLSDRCLYLLDSMVMEIVRPEDATKLITALLSALDLMAKHTGGYPAVKVEHTGKDGKAIEIEQTKLNVVWYMPEVEQLPDGATDSGALQDIQGNSGAGPIPDNEDQ